jgi:hypothetical protein
MHWPRIVASLGILVALGVGAANATCHESAFAVVAPCSASALSAPYHGDLAVVSVQSFGCDNGFAYLWATVGKGEQEIGVTETLRYDVATASWQNASRSTYCVHHRLPKYVQFWGCNSN